MDYKVIDGDGHVREPMARIRELLGPLGQRGSIFQNDTWDRQLCNTLGQYPESPQDQLRDMDADGIDVMVMYPTAALSLGVIADDTYAAAVANAYNTAVYEFCQADPARLKFVASLAPQALDKSVEELTRAATELGAVAAMLPTHIPLRPDWGHRWWDPLYAAAERLDIGLGFHHRSVHGEATDQRHHSFITVHTIGHPVEQMISLTSTIMGGVPERFPRLRLAFLEGGIGWVPFWMDRMDEEWEKRGKVEAPDLTRAPSAYIRGGNFYFGVECEEHTIPDGVRWGLEDTLLYSSDYPHWDADWPNTVHEVAERDDISDEVKRKMMHDNAVRFYKLQEAAVSTRATAGTAAR